METTDLKSKNEEFFRKRTKVSIARAHKKLHERIFYIIHQELRRSIEANEETRDPDLWQKELKMAKKIEKKYGRENLFYESEFDFGMDCGKLLLLGWYVGEFDDLSI